MVYYTFYYHVYLYITIHILRKKDFFECQITPSIVSSIRRYNIINAVFSIYFHDNCTNNLLSLKEDTS